MTEKLIKRHLPRTVNSDGAPGIDLLPAPRIILESIVDEKPQNNITRIGHSAGLWVKHGVMGTVHLFLELSW